MGFFFGEGRIYTPPIKNPARSTLLGSIVGSKIDSGLHTVNIKRRMQLKPEKK
jgi:hypothetical protein